MESSDCYATTAKYNAAAISSVSSLEPPCSTAILRPSSLSLKTLRWKSSSLILFLGPIGKLQNILVWIKRSPLGCELLHKLQLQLALTRPEGRNETYELITDVVTR